MPLAYDFDIAPTGARPALWRDSAVVAALRQADPIVQQYFRDSGFALGTYDSGAPPGRFPADDEAARADIINKLTENVHRVDRDGLNWGGFDLHEFLNYLGSAEPIAMVPPTPPTPPKAAVASSPPVQVSDPGPVLDFDAGDLRRAMQPSKRKGVAMIGLALGVILLGVAALLALP